MSIDKTLKLRNALVRHRNVLTRAQRIEELEQKGLWKEEVDSPFGLPKIRVLKAKKRSKKKKEEAKSVSPIATSADAPAPAPAPPPAK